MRPIMLNHGKSDREGDHGELKGVRAERFDLDLVPVQSELPLWSE